ncbi:MAG: PD-(D/E)XK nuclease family protein [Bacilli bacterium]|nr:PD-(D/E)XK nuclease family protein [Bacilli bacterium]
MKYSPYSVSKIECYLSCPKKFEYCYITKPKIKSSFKHLEKGNLWHTLIEHAIKRTTKDFKKPFLKELNHEEYLKELSSCLRFLKSNFFLPYLQDIMVYKQITEQRFSIDKNGKVFLDNIQNPMLKGFIDLIEFNDHEVQIIDWKTGGKSKENIEKYPKSKFQLEVYAYIAQMIYKPTKLTAKYVYVEHEVEKIFTNFNPRETWREITWNIETIENDKEFKRNESVLCDWCDFRGLCLI